MESSARHDDGEAYFLGWLDREPVSRRGRVLLVATAAALVWFWLPALSTVFVLVSFLGSPFAHPGPWVLLRHVLTGGIIAFAVGALAGAAFRRLKWLAGPVLLAIPLVTALLVALLNPGRIAPGTGQAVVRYSVGLSMQSAVYLGALFLLSALGGAVSSRLFRRLPLGVATNVALAWVGAAAITMAAVLWQTRSGFPKGTYEAWSLTDVALWGLQYGVYFVSGLWLGWALRRRPWVAATAPAAMAAFRVAAGQFRIIMPGVLATVLANTSFVLTCGVVAAVGGWLGGMLARQRPWWKLLEPVLVFGGAMVTVVVVTTVLVGSEAAGVSSAIESPVPNGEVVLLVKGKAIGALILTTQSVTPERVSYTWHYRTDGGGTFHAAEAGRFQSGQAKDATRISFGPFSVGWSAHDDHSGYLYYPRMPGEPVTADDVRICVTRERDLEQIDAFDPKWIFRASSSDPGRRLGRGGP